MAFYSTIATRLDTLVEDIKPPEDIKPEENPQQPLGVGDPIIQTKDLSVVYNQGTSNEYWALHEVSISIYPKEYIIFFGPSGCGKSTLLNSIAGLETNITGKVMVQGMDIAHLSEDEIAKFHRSGLGMVFQQYNLISSLSVMDNVTLPQVFIGTDRSERIAKAKVLLEKFGILKQADKIPTELSGGQQQRIGIARALVNDPKILLADEPVGNLDSVSAQTVMDLLKKLNTDEGKTLIMVTHNPEHLFYANRIFYMKDGKVVREVVNKDNRPPEVKEKMVEKKETVEEKLKKEFELLARSFPGLSPVQLSMLLIPFKAKMLVNYMLSAYDVDEIKRIEQIVSDRLSRHIDRGEFQLKLDQDYEKGGAGLDSRVAEKLALIVENVLEKTKFVKTANEEIDGQAAQSREVAATDIGAIWAQVAELRKSFIAPRNMILSEQQIKRLESAIYSRLIGDFDKDDFCATLDKSVKEGGVGLNKLTAEKLTRDLEMVMLVSYGLK